jgi:3-deoxy-7-phosphoheptulonate synthase
LKIDCSHGNSQKQFNRQVDVAECIVSDIIIVFVYSCSRILQARQLESGSTSASIMGVMIESNLVEGRQDIPPTGAIGLTYGQSVTDGKIHFSHSQVLAANTEDSLHKLGHYR